MRKFRFASRRLGAASRALAASLTLFAAGAAAAQSTGSTPAATDIGVHGSNTVGAALMPEFIRGYAKSRNLLLVETVLEDGEVMRIEARSGASRVFNINLERRGSSTSFRGMLAGAAEIGMSSRPIKDKEVAALKEAFGAEMRAPESEHIVALDGLTVIVHPQNPMLSATIETVARIFSGEISDWSALGGASAPIALHAPDDDSGTFDTFKTLVLDAHDRKIAPSAKRYAQKDLIREAVSKDRYAIGVLSLSQAGDGRAIAIALDCGLVISPSVFSVKSEEYPLSRRLFLYTLGVPKTPLARSLIEYAKSDDAQGAVVKVGYVDQSIELEAFAGYSNHIMSAIDLAESAQEREALKALIAMTRGASRLSTTLRFQEGGDLLEVKSINDAGRIARWLERPENRDARIIVLGFADNRGGFEANQPLSTARAEAVRRAILVQVTPGFDISRIRTAGFSSVAPVACNTTERGRAANRRVEIWALKPES